MTAFFRQDLANDQIAVPDRLQAWIDFLYERYPLGSSDITSGYASRIIWDIPVPWEALRGSFLAREGRIGVFDPPNLRELGWDPLYAGAFRVPVNRLHAGAPIPTGYRDTVGFLSTGTWGGQSCFVVPDGDGERVAVVSMESGPSGMNAETLSTMDLPAGVVPLHALTDQAVLTGSGTQARVYVLAKDTNESDQAVVYISDPSGTPIEVGRITTASGMERMLKYAQMVYFHGQDAGTTGRHKVWRLNVTLTNLQQTLVQQTLIATDVGGLFDKEFLIHLARLGEASAALAVNTDLILDTCLMHPTQDITPASEPVLFVAAENSGGTTNAIYRERGFWEGNVTMSTVAVDTPLGLGADNVKCLLQHGTSMVVLGDNGTTIKWAAYDMEAFSLTNSDALYTGSNAAGTTLMRESACSDGRFIYAMCADGNVARIDPSENSFEKFKPHAGFGASGLLGGNVVFTGRALVAHVAKSGTDGVSAMIRPY